MTVPIWLQNTVEVEWRRTRTVNTQQSPFSGDVWQSSNLDARWQARITYADMDRAQAAPLLAAIAAQRDGLGTFGLFDPDFAVPRSAFIGTGAVQTAPAIGATLLVTNGWTPSTLLARAGDKAWVNYTGGVWRMVEITADISSNGSGVASLPIDELPLPLPTVGLTVGFNWLGGQSVPMRLVSWQKVALPGARFRIGIEAEERV